MKVAFLEWEFFEMTFAQSHSWDVPMAQLEPVNLIVALLTGADLCSLIAPFKGLNDQKLGLRREAWHANYLSSF